MRSGRMVLAMALLLAAAGAARGQVTLTKQVSPAGAGTVTVTPSLATYTPGTAANIRATANAGYSFVSWSATGGSPSNATAATTWLTITDNCTLTANFAPASYALTTAVNPPGTGTVTVTPSQATYHAGDQVSIQAAAGPGYQFGGWGATGGTVTNPSAAATTLTITSSCALTANFLSLYSLSVSLPQGTATVTPSQAQYAYGSVVTLAASTINAGLVLDHWVLSGAGVLSNSCGLTTSLTVQGNVTVTAAYVSGSYVNNLSPWASDAGPGSLGQPFKTVNHATNLAHAGATIVILQGVYRESPSIWYGGAPGNPLSIKGNPGDRVVLTGADPVPSPSGSWTPCNSVTASGNANSANIYYTDLTWAPTTLAQDGTYLALAQTPLSGLPTWWTITGATYTSLTDTVHLTQTDSTFWVGANVCYWYEANAQQFWCKITGYTPGTSTIAIDTFLYPAPVVNAPATGGDWYYICNKVNLINGPGQWAVQAVSSNQYRVFVWPAGGGRPNGHLFEANRRNTSYTSGVFYLGYPVPGYLVIDGLEICGSRGDGISGGYGDGGGNWVVRNCVLHHNDGSGINGRGNVNGLYVHNIMTSNGLWPGSLAGGEVGCGIVTGDGAATETGSPQLILENEISFNGDDAIFAGVSNQTISGNYIHDHWMWEHTDNIQFALGDSANGDYVLNNLFLSSNDGTQANTNSNTYIIGNTFVGLMSFPIQGGYYGTDVEHNTFLFPGWGGIGDASVSMTLLNNLTDVGYYHWIIWSGATGAGYSYASDYNLFYFVAGTPSTTPVVSWNGNSNRSLAQYAATSSQDTHSVYGDPKFANAPAFASVLQWGKFNDFRPNRVYLLDGYNALANLAVGDYIEIGTDGVLRQVTVVNTTANAEYVEFTPSDAKFVYKFCCTLVDWKSNPSTTRSLDLTLQSGSPALGKGSGGSNMGASLNVKDYMAGKLNGSATRVLPNWPPAAASATQWAVMATHSGTVVGITASEGRVEPRLGPTGLAINFDYALSAATVNSAAVTIVNETGSSYAGQVAAVGLDAAGQVLTVTLASPLPDGHWYTIALNPAITAANGGPVRGTKSVKIGLLAGNVTGSGHVTAADVAAVRGHVGQAVTAATAAYDLDGSGVITAADQRQVQMLVGHSLP